MTAFDVIHAVWNVSAMKNDMERFQIFSFHNVFVFIYIIHKGKSRLTNLDAKCFQIFIGYLLLAFFLNKNVVKHQQIFQRNS